MEPIVWGVVTVISGTHLKILLERYEIQRHPGESDDDFRLRVKRMLLDKTAASDIKPFTFIIEDGDHYIEINIRYSPIKTRERIGHWLCAVLPAMLPFAILKDDKESGQ